MRYTEFGRRTGENAPAMAMEVLGRGGAAPQQAPVLSRVRQGTAIDAKVRSPNCGKIRVILY